MCRRPIVIAAVMQLTFWLFYVSSKVQFTENKTEIINPWGSIDPYPPPLNDAPEKMIFCICIIVIFENLCFTWSCSNAVKVWWDI